MSVFRFPQGPLQKSGDQVVNLLRIDGGERVVEGFDDVVSVPRAGDKGTQSCGDVKNMLRF